MQQEKFGIFISYRRSCAFFAGRIHDFLASKGFNPFMDVYCMKQNNYEEEIHQKIDECPYFLLVLNRGCLDGLSEDDVFAGEIRHAIDRKDSSDILIVSDDKDTFPGGKPLLELLRKLEKHQCDIITHNNFIADMEHLIRNIDNAKLNGVINWRKYIAMNGNAIIASRDLIEKQFATMENRFGKELVEAVKSGVHFDGSQIIKQIRMSCYAASIVFNPARDMVDDKAYDNGLLFNTFTELLRDPEFSLEIIINAPDSPGAREAIANDMLGNSSLDEYPEAVFYGAYAGISRLIMEVPEFNHAYQEKRFRFYLTDVVMNGAIFQIEYKELWQEFDHIKYDIYSYNLSSNMERQCALFFRADNIDNYESIAQTYNYLKKRRYKKAEVQEKHEIWMQRWNAILDDLENT